MIDKSNKITTFWSGSYLSKAGKAVLKQFLVCYHYLLSFGLFNS